MTLGICDWGSGGLRLYRAVRAARPDVDIVYLDDRGSEVYSLLTRESLSERVQLVVGAFNRIGVHRVVLASDAASTVIGEISTPGVSVSGLVGPTLRAMRDRTLREVGIIGGQRTILSGAYGRALRKLRFMVIQRVSLDLDQMIESGKAGEADIRQAIEGLLEPLAKVDGLLLANTHYTIVEPIIRSLLPKAEIINPTDCAVAELIDELKDVEGATGRTTFYTTGDPSESRKRALALYDLNLESHELAPALPQLAA